MVNAPDPVVAFAEYTQQVLGVPWPTHQDLRILRKKIKEFFSHYPKLDYYTLCRVVAWARARRRRFNRVWAVVDAFRDAFKEGAIPELEPDHREAPVEERIASALAVETMPTWRRILLGAQGVEARRKVLGEWETTRGGDLLAGGATSGVH